MIEQTIQENTSAIRDLIAALLANPPAVSEAAKPDFDPEPEEEPEPAKKVKKAPVAKAEPAKQVKKAAALKAPAIEEDDDAEINAEDDAMLDSMVGVDEPGVFKLPAGERNRAYYEANVQKHLVALGAMDGGATLAKLVRGKYRCQGKADAIPSERWDDLVFDAIELLGTE